MFWLAGQLFGILIVIAGIILAVFALIAGLFAAALVLWLAIFALAAITDSIYSLLRWKWNSFATVRWLDRVCRE